MGDHMNRTNYNSSSLTIGATTYSLLTPVDVVSVNYIIYSLDELYIVGGKVYAEVGDTGGAVSDLLPDVPMENDIVAIVNLLYHSSVWWIMVGQ